MTRSHFAAGLGLALALVIGSGVALAAPTSVTDLYRESYRLEAAGKAAEALEPMNKVKASAGASYFVAVRVGWLAYLAGRFADAAAAYREGIQLAPAAVEPRLGLTLPLLAQKSWRELESACRDVLKLDPNNGVARTRLALAHYSIGNYPDAAVVYRKLMEEYPAELDHQTGLGWALARMGRTKEAKALFAAVLAVSPDNWNALQGMTLP
jgi:tetratricopeptide (TPR) repeat protein